jgi:hypothetical protein
LSEGRVRREGPYPSWGTTADLFLLQAHIESLLARAPAGAFPRSRAAIEDL